MYNLKELAELNQVKLSKELEEKILLQDKNTVNRINNLLNAIETDSIVCINMKTDKLLKVIESGFYINCFEKYAQDSGIGFNDFISQNKEDIINSMYGILGDFSKNRVDFSSKFIGGFLFKYLSLNMPNSIGIQRFGKLCVELKRERILTFKVCVAVKKDSLLFYYENDDFNVNKFLSDIVVYNSLNKLVLDKHFEDIVNDNYNLNKLCSNDSYIEIIVGDRITSDSLLQVYISEEEYDRCFKELHKKAINKTLTPWEKKEYNDFCKMVSSLGRNKIQLRKVAA